MKLRPLMLRTMAVAGSIALAPIAQAQSLEIAPGQWKKTLKMEKGGKTLMNQTLDACMTREGLDFQQFRNKFAGNKGVCKLAEDEVTGKRVRVTIQCAGSTTRSTTEVKSREFVVVNATTEAGGEKTTSYEEWRFVKSQCDTNTR